MAYLSAIVAVDSQWCIGNKEGHLPWPTVRQDMARFRLLTLGKVCIMGGNTFRSLPTLLCDRYSIVVSRKAPPGLLGEKGKVVPTIEAAIEEACSLVHNDDWHPEVMVIGGQQIYTELLPQTRRVYMTWFEKYEVPQKDVGARFPGLSPSEWRIQSMGSGTPDPVVGGVSFATWVRTQKLAPSRSMTT